MSMNSSPTTPFVNHGLERWEAARAAFLQGKAATPPVSKPVDVEVIIDKIFGQSSSEEFDKVSLPMMINILNDLWLAEGE